MGKQTAQVFSKSKTSLEPREYQDQHINQRWEQLYKLEKESGLTALQYLFLINAGGSAATLAFIGTIGAQSIGLGVKIALALFISGVILSGISPSKTVS